MNKSGIYIIRCLKSIKVYIGSAFDLEKRKYKHFNTLQHNRHQSKLQNAFNKYGIENFTFEVLEYVPKLENESKLEFKKRLVNEREQYYLDTILFASENNYKFDELGYNINRKADSRLGVIQSKETNKKIGNWQRYNKKECPYCHRFFDIRNYAQFHGDLCYDNPLINKEVEKLRRKQSNEIIEKRSLKLKNVLKTKKHKEKLSIKQLELRQEKIQCEYCHEKVDKCNFVRWHGDKCIENKNLTIEQKNQLIIDRKTKKHKKRKIEKCTICGFECDSSNLKQHHNNNCKHKRQKNAA